MHWAILSCWKWKVLWCILLVVQYYTLPMDTNGPCVPSTHLHWLSWQSQVWEMLHQQGSHQYRALQQALYSSQHLQTLDRMYIRWVGWESELLRMMHAQNESTRGADASVCGHSYSETRLGSSYSACTQQYTVTGWMTLLRMRICIWAVGCSFDTQCHYDKHLRGN